MDALQYFHYGTLVQNGTPKGNARVLAKTTGVGDNFIELATKTAKVPALPNSTGVSWGIVRMTRGQPLAITRAEMVTADTPLYQFIQLPSSDARALAGNLSVLKPYLLEPLPTYEMLGDNLNPIVLPDVAPTNDEQVDSLLDLMSYARNNIRNIQPLITAVVTGTPLIILNAPEDGEVRMGFMQGLLSLLPSSTRLGVTFLTYNTPESKIKAQVMFMEQAPSEDKQVIYDWETGTVTGGAPTNDYGRFITSQMRLDPELVAIETDKLTPTAGWRFNQGDSLAAALDYASHRSKVDQSLRNGMPVEASSVAKILAEDPTLSDDQRLMYSRHLINFSLALDDLQYVDAITATMQQHKEIEDEVYKYMAQALADGNPTVIFETLVRWNSNPFSPVGAKWADLLTKSALAELDALVADEDHEKVSDYLDDLNLLGLQARSIIGRVIDRVLPLAGHNAEIPPKILLMAIRNLDDTKLQMLMTEPRFVKPLPTDIKRLLALYAQPDRQAPPSTLIRAVNSLDPSVRPQALIAFVKQAYGNNRIDLIDERVLNEIVTILDKNPSELGNTLVVDLARRIRDETLIGLKRPAPRLLLQLLVVTRNFDELGLHMSAQARDIYRAEGQSDYIISLQRAFGKATLSVEDAEEAIRSIEAQGIADVALSAVILGLLEGTKWDSDMQPYADRVMRDADGSLRLMEVLPPQTMFSLIQFQARQGDDQRMRVATRMMGSCAAYDTSKVGLSAANRTYKLLASNARTRKFAIEVVRQYVREAQEKPARHMIKFYSDRLGKDVAEKLQTSYEFSNMMSRLDWMTYATWLQLTVDLLQAVVESYDEKNRKLTLADVRLVAENIRQYSSVGQQKEIGEEMRQMTQYIVMLAQQHVNRSSTSDKHNEAVVRGSTSPKSMVDVFRAAGGYLLGKTTYPFRVMERSTKDPFGKLNTDELLTSATVARTMLGDTINAGADTERMWEYESIIDEIESQRKALLGDVSADLKQMGRNWQRLADLIVQVVRISNTKIIEPSNSYGRKLDRLEAVPRTPLELFRSIYGYFS